MTDNHRQRCFVALARAWNRRAVVCAHTQRVPIGEMVDAVLAVPNPEVERLRGEVARLREGEAADPPAPGVTLTPAEWMRKYNDATPEQRLKVVAHLLDSAERAARCYELDHTSAIEKRDAARAIIARSEAALASFDGRGVNNADIPTLAEVLDAWRKSLRESPIPVDENGRDITPLDQLRADLERVRTAFDLAEELRQKDAAEVRRLREELERAIAHDRQPYPTQWAYDQACAALEKHQERADRAEAAVTRVRELASAARGSLGAGCTCPQCEDDESDPCDNFGRPIAWNLDPAAVLAALDDKE